MTIRYAIRNGEFFKNLGDPPDARGEFVPGHEIHEEHEKPTLKTWDLELCDGDSGECYATMEEYPNSGGDYILVDDLLKLFCTDSEAAFQEILTLAIRRKGG